MKLHLSDTLSFPIDAATQTFAFVARKGAGKTYGAGKLNELLLDAGVQCVILDTVGNWYGLRIAADGKGKGFDIPVLGGLRGDIPLEPTGGELVADLVVDTGRSVILDVSQFSQNDRKRFATAFARQLWQRKKSERNPTPVFITLEEAQLIVPQMVRSDDAAMVGIWEEIIRLGRNYGIGVAMITQRPQSVNKEVLTQTECLVVLQVNGAPERKALREWIVHQGMDTHLVEELPKLPIGTAYVWSPQWLGILQKIQIAKKKTFDASATPKVGEKRLQRELGELDIEAFKDKMAATIEKAKENDVTHLKRTIADQKREIQKLQTAKPAVPAAAVKTKEVPILKEKQIESLLSVADRVQKFANQLIKLGTDLTEAIRTGNREGQALTIKQLTAPAPQRQWHSSILPVQAPSRPVAPRPVTNGAPNTLPKAEKAILRVLANFPEGKPKKQVARIAGYSHNGGGFGNALGALRSKGLIGGTSDFLQITPEGMEINGPVEPLPTGEELYQYWSTHPDMGKGEREILRVLYEARRAMTKEEVAPLTISNNGQPYEASGGGFGNAIGRLRTYELVEGKGTLQLAAEFFE